MSDFGELVSLLLEKPCEIESVEVPDSLNGVYELSPFQDLTTGQDYCVLYSKSTTQPWGTVIVNRDPDARNLSIDSIHPLFDRFTGELSMAVFSKTRAQTFLLSGSHRHAMDEPSPCSGDDNHFRISDPAHAPSVLLSAARAINQYYRNYDLDYTAIQLHGMSKLSCPGVDAFLSYGVDSSSPGLGKEKIDIFRDELQAVFEDVTFTIPGETPECHLLGTGNIIGKMINGVEKGNICNSNVTASVHSGHFLHIEIKLHLRKLEKVAFDSWGTAIVNAYDRMQTAFSPPASASKRQHGRDTSMAEDL